MNANPRSTGPPQLALVFAGGGAKGVAYVGALQALKEEGLTPAAVAGASAGAITAALVACGFDAARVKVETLASLENLAAQMPPRPKPGIFGTFRRYRIFRRLLSGLRRRGAAFESKALREWLAGLLEESVMKDVPIGPRPDGNTVTFKQLFDKTDIDLFVVAANVSRKEQVVFNHHTTPECQVVDAVLASSGLPGAFESGKLIIRERLRASPQRLHTVVDGGIWANYPEFVFKDQSFREFVGLPERHYRVIGFILEETKDPLADRKFGRTRISRRSARNLYRTARFQEPADPDKPRKYARTEAFLVKNPQRARSSRAVLAIVSVILATLATGVTAPLFSATFRRPAVLMVIFAATFLSYLAWLWIAPLRPEKNMGMDDSWPRNPLMRVTRTALRFIRPAGWVVVALAFVAPSVLMILMDDGPAMTTATDWWFRPVTSAFILAGVTVAGFVSLLVVTSFRVLALTKKALSDAGWGIAQTYAAGPAAPPWAGAAKGDWVVRVPVPKEISLLTFDVAQDIVVLNLLCEKVKKASKEQLVRILEAAPAHEMSTARSG